MPKIKVDDINLYYEMYGEGQPIVFVSGFSGDRTAWQNLIECYSSNYQVIVFDNRGIGKTDCPCGRYTTDMMAHDTAKLIQALNLGPVHLIGHSFGGCIVQTVAYKYPSLVKSIVLANTFLKCNMRLKLYGEIRQEMVKAKAPSASIIKFVSLVCWSNNYLSHPGRITELVEQGFFPISVEGYEGQLHAMLTFDSWDWVGKIKKPCLVIAADEDLLADVEDAEYMRDNIKSSEYFCFHKVGHVPMQEQTESFNNLLLDFLNKQL